jgi:uncharacterized protein YraI
MKERYVGAVTLAAAMLMSTSAFAALSVSATADLNIRGGPGPQFPVLGMIRANDQAAVQGCIEGSKWCQVSYQGISGWVYGDYLSANVGGQTQVVMQLPANQLPRVQFDGGTAAGAAAGAVAGALIGGPPGAVVGGVIGATAGTAIDPPTQVRTYVVANRASPVFLDGEVVVGATIPANVQLQTIPDYQYSYVYVNGLPVLVEPSTRRIVYIYRS